MKRIYSIFFILLFFVCLFGHNLVFEIAKKKIKREAREMLASLTHLSEMDVLELSVSDTLTSKFKRKNAKEVVWNGLFFDYVKIEVVNSKVRFYGIYDKKEGSLFAWKNVINKHSNNSNSNGNFIYYPKINLFYISNINKNNLHITSEIYFAQYKLMIAHQLISIELPPPKFI